MQPDDDRSTRLTRTVAIVSTIVDGVHFSEHAGRLRRDGMHDRQRNGEVTKKDISQQHVGAAEEQRTCVYVAEPTYIRTYAVKQVHQDSKWS